MKRFLNYLSEKTTPDPSYEVKWMSSAWKHIIGDHGTGRRSVPFTSTLINKIWKTPIRATVFHVTDTEGATHVLQNQRKKGVALSVMALAPKLGSSLFEQGIWRAGVVLKLEANILMAGMSDIMSVPDESGRRWLAIPEVARTLPMPINKDFAKEMEAKQKTVYEDFAKTLIKYAQTITDDTDDKKFVKANFLKSNWSYDSYDRKYIVGRIIDFRDSQTNAEKAEINKIIGRFVNTHIKETNKILEKYFMDSKERVAQIADGKGGGIGGDKRQISGLGYSELVANEYRVIGIAWMPYVTKWGIGEDRLRAAAGAVPILVVARKAAEDSDSFKDHWFPPTRQTPEERHIRAAYHVFARKGYSK